MATMETSGRNGSTAGANDKQPDTDLGAPIRPAGSSLETWDRIADAYDAARAHDRVYQTCLATTTRAIEALKPRRLMDAGCGTGLATLPLCVRGRTVAAVDHSSASLTVLRGKSGAAQAFQADVRALPFLSGTFDVVLCANTLQHLAPAQQLLAVNELQRLVARGGSLVVMVHHFSEVKRRAGWIKEGRPGQPGIDYIFRFTVDDLARLLPGARIAAMGLGEWPWLPSRLQELLSESFVGPSLAKNGYGHMLLAVQNR